MPLPPSGIPKSPKWWRGRRRGIYELLSRGNATIAQIAELFFAVPGGAMAILAPVESERSEPARRFLQRVLAEDNPVTAVHFLDVRQSMKNGGGPACLRQRIWLTAEQVAAVRANVFFTQALHDALESWIRRHYRDRLLPGDLADPALARESMAALDELTRILQLGSVYDFQRISSGERPE